MYLTSEPKNSPRLDMIWDDLKIFYDELGAPASQRIPDLRRKQFETSKGFPEMSGKAAHMRHLVPALLRLLDFVACSEEGYENETKYNDTFREIVQHRKFCLQHLNEYYMIIKKRGRYLSRSMADKVVDAVSKSTEHYAMLATLAREHVGCLMYNIVPKTHLVHHIAEAAVYENPKHSWVYMEEDFIGRVCKMARHAALGAGGARLTKGLMNKYLRLIYVRLHYKHNWSADTARVVWRDGGLVGLHDDSDDDDPLW